MLIDTLKRVPAFEAEKLKPGHPTLGAIVSSINESPDIKAYLAARKETDF